MRREEQAYEQQKEAWEEKRELSTTNFAAWLESRGACVPARDWARGKPVDEIIATSPFDWLNWLAIRVLSNAELDEYYRIHFATWADCANSYEYKRNYLRTVLPAAVTIALRAWRRK
jgi:hypothetical protein